MKIICLLAVSSLCLSRGTAGAAQDEIAPYKFAEVQSPNGGLVYVYKSVHEGCELYIAAGELRPDHNGPNTSVGATVAIATGRGCK